MITLAAAFQVNGSLQVVNLGANQIGDSGTMALAKDSVNPRLSLHDAAACAVARSPIAAVMW